MMYCLLANSDKNMAAIMQQIDYNCAAVICTVLPDTNIKMSCLTNNCLTMNIVVILSTKDNSKI